MRVDSRKLRTMKFLSNALKNKLAGIKHFNADQITIFVKINKGFRSKFHRP